ncbi:MAG: H-type lectin domain-containing protein [Pseudomonadota bacterium]
MNSVNPLTLAIAGGVTKIFDHIENKGPMWAGSGKRWAREVVAFSEPFSHPPTVQLSISVIDADSGRNLRLDLHTEDVTCDSFTAVAHTWSDTRIGRLQVNWTAIGSRIEGATPVWNV